MSQLLIVGHGRMGSLVASLASDYGFDVVGIVYRPMLDIRLVRGAFETSCAW